MKKPKHKKTLQDLRPCANIHCLYCGESKPQTGSVKFRAHLVCKECVVKLQTMEQKCQ